MAGNLNFKAAQRLREKYELYVLSLAFTLLGLAIQTAKFDGPVPQRIAELVGWFLLLVSGLVGVLRLPLIPPWLMAHDETQEIRGEVISQLASKSIDKALLDRIAGLETSTLRLGSQLSWMGLSQTWTLIVGIVAIAISRAYVPFRDLVAALCR